MLSSSWDLMSPTTRRSPLSPAISPASSPSMAELSSRLAFLRDLTERCPSPISGDDSLSSPCMATFLPSPSAPSPPPSERVMLTNDACRSSLSSLLALTSSCTGASVSSPPPSLRVFMHYEMKNTCMDQKASYVGLDQPKPSVNIDHDSDESSTLVKVDDPCGGKSLVHILNIFKGLNLEVQKAYLMTDGPFYFHVFHITDCFGKKLLNPWICYQIGCRLTLSLTCMRAPLSSSADIELTCTYHPDIIPLATSLLLKAGCQIESLHSRKYGSRLAAIIRIASDQMSYEKIEQSLSDLLKGFEIEKPRAHEWVRVTTSCQLASMERRLFWLAMDDLHYNKVDEVAGIGVAVSVTECKDTGYLLVRVEGQEGRTSLTKAQTAIVSTIVNLGYDIRHGTATPSYQEYYISGDEEGLAGTGEPANLRRWLEWSLSFSSSLQGSKVLNTCVMEKGGSVGETMEWVRQQNGLRLSGAMCYTDGCTTLAQFALHATPLSETEVEKKNKKKKEIEKKKKNEETKMENETVEGRFSTGSRISLSLMNLKAQTELEAPQSTLRKVLGFGGLFLRGLTKAAKLYASTLE